MSKSKALAKRGAPIQTLAPRTERLIDLMVHGLDYRDSRLPDKPTYQPLTSDQAATVLGIKRTAASRLLAEPAVKAALAQAVADKRGAAQPAIIANLEAIATTQVLEPKGSDVIAAAKLLMGEDSKGFSVNVQVNNQTNIANAIRPGYVLDLSALKDKSEPHTIEGKAE